MCDAGADALACRGSRGGAVSVHCPVNCRTPDGSVPCGREAVVVFTAPDRAIAACAEHEAKARRWASYSGRHAVTERRLGQEPDTLF